MNILKNEINIFFTAIMFFTRIPCPKHIDHSFKNLSESRKYFPLVGTLVGLCVAVIFYLFQYIFNPATSIIVSTIFSVLLTGAFHEDGLADLFDGIGGGWTKEQILEIMKDSRLGTFGSVSLFLILLLKISLLIEIDNSKIIFISLVSAHTMSRFVATIIVQKMDYVQEDQNSKAKPIAIKKFNPLKQALSSLPIAFLIILYPPNTIPYLLAILPLIYLIPLFNKKLGGYTGDCLGATQQISEVCFYLGVVLTCKFL